jgi:hypothetical protein
MVLLEINAFEGVATGLIAAAVSVLVTLGFRRYDQQQVDWEITGHWLTTPARRP